MQFLIYAAYGSNLLKERFMAYIKGGYFCGRDHNRCEDDPTEPVDLGWIYVPHRLYFAKSSQRWQKKGVAFLACEKEKDTNFHAVVRLWRISEIQFEHLKQEEGPSWYGRELVLGEIGGLEIKTITGCWEREKKEPSQEYLSVIKCGLKETTGWDEDKIEQYLKKFL